jgi:hypothetical protein
LRHGKILGSNAGKGEKAGNPGGQLALICLATLLVPHPAPAEGHACRLRFAIRAKSLSRGAAGYLNRLLYPGTFCIAMPPELNVDFVVNAALVVKTLQVRQQGGRLHRLWCWPQRSSHGQDQLGYQPCTLTRGPAPKSTQPLFYLAVFFVLCLSPEIARRSSRKKLNSSQVLRKGLKILFAGQASDDETRFPIQNGTRWSQGVGN